MSEYSPTEVMQLVDQGKVTQREAVLMLVFGMREHGVQETFSVISDEWASRLYDYADKLPANLELEGVCLLSKYEPPDFEGRLPSTQTYRYGIRAIREFRSNSSGQ